MTKDDRDVLIERLEQAEADLLLCQQEKERLTAVVREVSAVSALDREIAEKHYADLLLCQHEKQAINQHANELREGLNEARSTLKATRQGIAPVVEAMRVIERVAGQCSVEGLPDTLSLMAAAESERARQWAETLARLLVTTGKGA